jgi:hypothetical protein
VLSVTHEAVVRGRLASLQTAQVELRSVHATRAHVEDQRCRPQPAALKQPLGHRKGHQQVGGKAAFDPLRRALEGVLHHTHVIHQHVQRGIDLGECAESGHQRGQVTA